MIVHLQNQIPSFECIPGCCDCCGPVPWSEWEAAQLPEDVPMKVIKASEIGEIESKICGFATEKGCAVYDARPIMCRLYGTVEDLRCPHGRGPEKLLTKKQAGEILAGYIHFLKGGSHNGDSFRCPC